MKSPGNTNSKCVEKTDYIVPFLMILFFIAGYLVFKKKSSRPISPTMKPNKYKKNQLIQQDFDSKINENEEFEFFLN